MTIYEPRRRAWNRARSPSEGTSLADILILDI